MAVYREYQTNTWRVIYRFKENTGKQIRELVKNAKRGAICTVMAKGANDNHDLLY